jgi:hypothetical protein
LALARAGLVSRAAERLRTDHTTVARHIRSLDNLKAPYRLQAVSLQSRFYLDKSKPVLEKADLRRHQLIDTLRH